MKLEKMRIKLYLLKVLDNRRGANKNIQKNIPIIIMLFLIEGFYPIAYSQAPCLTINVINLTCEADITPENVYDNTYGFSLEINGGSSGWKAEYENNVISGAYGSPVNLSNLALSNGPVFFLVYDTLNPSCANTYTLNPPNCNTCTNTVIPICDQENVLLTASRQNLWGHANYATFQWYKDGNAILSATDSFYIATEVGTYMLRGYYDFFNQNANCYDSGCCSFTVIGSGSFSAVDDVLSNNCPGISIEGNVSWNDTKSNNSKYTLVTPPSSGNLTFDSTGYFSFLPSNNNCLVEQFVYSLCNQTANCCDTAIVTLDLSDVILPQLIDIPANETIHCDEQIPIPELITAIDNCPAISIRVTEENTQGEDGCSLYDYTLTRTWTATDACGNITSDSQVVDIQDITPPGIFRIYTLPNGKKLVAGISEYVNQNWKTVSLPIDFPTTPLVFTQVITKRESMPVTTRLRNISSSQFELKLQEEEAEDDLHLRERVAWIAIESGNQTTNYPLEAREISLTSAWETVDFQENYAVFPSFFATIQTTFDNDPAVLRFNAPSLNGIQMQIEEELSFDAEDTHSTESIAFLGIEHEVDLVDAKGRFFGETGSVSVDERIITITTTHNYYNPIIIAGPPQHRGGDPGLVRVNNVKSNSFDIQFQEWDYRDGNHTFEYVSYIVIEGSLPLDVSLFCEDGTDSLEIGKDIIAIDNCDANVALQYEENEIVDGNATQIIRSWYAVDECNNATGYSQIVPCSGVGIRLKAILQGAILQSNDYGLMRDDLRQKGLLPTVEPYTNMQNFDHVGTGGGEECLPEMFTIAGEKAIVDWMFIELKQADNPEAVVATCAALLQRDGHIISASGDSILYFDNLPPDNYYITIRHRNHLKAETFHPYFIDEFNIPFIDFTYQFLPTIGEEPFTDSEGGNAMWSGDLTQDEKTIYQGPNNDIFAMLLQVILDDKNTQFIPNFINRAYSVNDFNLDGTTIYQGPNNDRANLLFNTVLIHPNNNKIAPNFILSTRENTANSADCLVDNTLPSCDFDKDGKLNHTDSDDDNDGVVDGNDVDAYDRESDSDGDNIKDKIEVTQGSNPLNPCDPFQDHSACQGIDVDRDGKFGNYPISHSLYDDNDQNACTPNSTYESCGCIDEDGDAYIFICHTSLDGVKQTLRIKPEEWQLRNVIGDSCGACQQ